MKSKKLKEVMYTINEIDRQHNGYVTRNEMDDILKMCLKEQLSLRNLMPIINKFCSIQNKILIDYNLFKKWIDKEFKIETTRLSMKNVEGMNK